MSLSNIHKEVSLLGVSLHTQTFLYALKKKKKKKRFLYPFQKNYLGKVYVHVRPILLLYHFPSVSVFPSVPLYENTDYQKKLNPSLFFPFQCSP